MYYLNPDDNLIALSWYTDMMLHTSHVTSSVKTNVQNEIFCQFAAWENDSS